MLRVLVVVVSLAAVGVAQDATTEETASAGCARCAASDSATTTGSTAASPTETSSPVQLSRAAVDGAVLQPANITPSAQPIMAISTPSAPRRPSEAQKKIWWTLTAAQHGAATFDAWSTRKSLTSGNGYERNPLMKPFADSAAIYPVIQVVPLGLDFVSKRMMTSRHGFLRKTWWLPQTIAAAGFIWSGARNMNVANRGQ